MLVPGDTLEVTVAAKGGGSENKARFATLNPGASVVDWVLETVPELGAGWCPPGMIGLGIGGSAEKAMLLAKEALLEPIDMTELLARGPAGPEEELRVELYEKINALGIGAQGLGGLTTVVDVKVKTFPTHAASKPVALIPQCAANRHATIVLDGSGPARLDPPDLSRLAGDRARPRRPGARRVRSRPADARGGRDLAARRDAAAVGPHAHRPRRRARAHRTTSCRPASRCRSISQGRVIYYVGPVDPVRDEAVGPAGPTTATRMDRSPTRCSARPACSP